MLISKLLKKLQKMHAQKNIVKILWKNAVFPLLLMFIKLVSL